MPWMPEVFSAPIAEAIRRQEEMSGANDAVAYYEGIMANEPEALVRSFAARQPVLDDPRVGYVEGIRELRAFVNGTADWLRERDAVVENVALTRTGVKVGGPAHSHIPGLSKASWRPSPTSASASRI